MKFRRRPFRSVPWNLWLSRTQPFCSSSYPFLNDHYFESEKPNTDSASSSSSSSSSSTSSWNCNKHLLNQGSVHKYKNWEGQRRWRLTASTVASSVGFFPGRREQLWAEKVGLIDPFSGSVATCWNNVHEQIAMDRYKLISGNQVEFTGLHIYSDPRFQWMAASPDGLINRDEYGDLLDAGILEIKCPYLRGNADRYLPWSKIPACYIAQAQGLMEILNRNWVDFYVWTPMGSSLFRIERDASYWQILMVALCEFWLQHVEPARVLRALDPSVSVMRYRPKSRHRLFRLISQRSEEISSKSKLLVREVNGRIIN